MNAQQPVLFVFVIYTDIYLILENFIYSIQLQRFSIFPFKINSFQSVSSFSQLKHFNQFLSYHSSNVTCPSGKKINLNNQLLKYKLCIYLLIGSSAGVSGINSILSRRKVRSNFDVAGHRCGRIRCGRPPRRDGFHPLFKFQEIGVPIWKVFNLFLRVSYCIISSCLL